MVRSAQCQSALLLFLKTTWPRLLFTLCLLSKEACLYTGADWLSSSVSQRVARGQLSLCPFVEQTYKKFAHCSVSSY